MPNSVTSSAILMGVPHRGDVAGVENDLGEQACVKLAFVEERVVNDHHHRDDDDDDQNQEGKHGQHGVETEVNCHPYAPYHGWRGACCPSCVCLLFIELDIEELQPDFLSGFVMGGIGEYVKRVAFYAQLLAHQLHLIVVLVA